MGGLRFVTGYPDRPPVLVGISIGDSLAGVFGALDAQAALYRREAHSGRGQVVDVAIYEAVFAIMESLLSEYDLLGFVRARTGNILPGVAPSNIPHEGRRVGRYRSQRRRRHRSDSGPGTRTIGSRFDRTHLHLLHRSVRRKNGG